MAHLTDGCIRRVHENGSLEQRSDNIVVQVLEVKKIQPNANQSGDRYRLVISDGSHYIQGMLATQLNQLVSQGRLQAGSIIQLKQYICNEINTKKVIIMLDVEILQDQAEHIGDPKPITAGAGGPQQAGVPKPYGGVKAEARSQANYMSKGVSGASGSGMMGGAGSAAGVVPIASLHPYNNRWTIKARVTSKGERRTWSNAKGDGSLFSIDLLDAHGGQIRATMFKDAADKFWDVFQENGVYTISKGQLKAANKKFSRIPNDYELTLNSDAEVYPVEDDQGIQAHRFEFVTIEQITKIAPEEFCDVIGIVHAVAPIAQINTKTGRQLEKRTVTLIDKTLCQVEVTLWGEQALKWNEAELDGYPVMVVKACKVSDFGGRSLSSSFQSQLFVNPDVPEAHQLRAWYDANHASLTDVQNISKGPRGGEGGGAASNVRKILSDIKDENLGAKDKPDFFTTRAVITFFKHDWEKGSPPWYMACPSAGCNKKVTPDNGGWVCDKCSKTHPNASARYILSLMVCDHSGSTWLTAFNDAAQALLGGFTADQMNQYKTDNNKGPVDEIFKGANFREYNFKIRAKQEPSQDGEPRVRAHILSATPINYVAESNYLFDEIAKYD